MKKFLIALLMMAVVLVGVFADPGLDGYTDAKTSSNGTAQINITTTIKEEWPKFQLATKSGVNAAAVNAVNAIDDDYTGAVLTDALNTTLTETADSTVTVGFAINQVSDSRTKDNYVLTVTATDLVLVTPVVGDAIAFDNANRTADQKFTVVDGTPGVTATQNLTNIAPTASNNALTTHYNGKKITANLTDKVVELGVFDVEWNTNLNAEAGAYEAHIILTVTSAV